MRINYHADGYMKRPRAERKLHPRRRLSKNPRRAREGRSPLEFKSCPAACTAGAGLFYRREIPFPGEKIATLQILRPESERLKQNLVGVAVAGELAPPPTIFYAAYLTQ